MARKNNKTDWEPVGIQWGTTNGICYCVNHQPAEIDLASYPVREPQANQTEPLRIEPPPPASPPRLPPGIGRKKPRR